MKIAVITCYFDPNHVRARSIRAAIKANKNVRTILVQNQHRGLLRYPEVAWKLLKLRFTDKPDVWVLTFRGQEILPLVLLLAWNKPVVFDELVIPLAYAKDEGHKRSFSITVHHLLARMSALPYKYWLRRCCFIVADTLPHAELSARLSQVNFRHYRVIPVGTDEAVLKGATYLKYQPENGPFEVLFCGNMKSLYGLQYVLEAALTLKNRADINFSIIGGKRQSAAAVEAARQAGAHVSYQKFLPFEKLPKAIARAGLCLGGHFGNTPQAQHAVSGKAYQYLACAAPTVIGISEASEPFFKDKLNALIVPQANASALVKVIVWAVDNPTELVKIGQAGRRLYEREFSSAVIAAKFSDLLDELPAA